MTSTQNLIDRLQQSGIELAVSEGKLISRALPGAIDDETGRLIRQHKADLIAFLQEQAAQKDTEAGSLAYWSQQLRDLPEAGFLPLDGPRLLRQWRPAFTVEQRLDPAATAGLLQLAATHAADLRLVVHSALAVLLARWGNCDDLVIGAVCDGRPDVLPLRTRLSPDAHFAAVLAEHVRLWREALAHPLPPPERLRQALELPCDDATYPLLQVRFALHDPSMLAPPAELTPCDVDVVAYLDGETLALRWSFACGQTAPPSAQRMMAALADVLAHVVRDSDVAVARIPLLSQADMRQLQAWRGAVHPYPREACVHHLIESQAEKTPEAVAMRCGGRALTYREFNGKANGLARELAQAGCGHGDVVAILMTGDLEVPLAFMAAMKLGAVFAPLDMNWPVERLTAVLRRMQPALVLANVPTSLELAGVAIRQVNADTLALAPNLDVPCSADMPIYIVHTSGSTGEPKGAVNLHRGIVNRLCFMRRHFGAAAGGRVLQTTNHCFDSAVWQYFWPLTLGGACIIPPVTGSFDLAGAAALVFSEQVTMTDFTPAMLHLFSEQVGQLPSHRDACHLQHVIVGGEELTPAAVQKFFQALPQVRLHNFYGPSETSIGILCHEVTAAEAGRAIPVGRPIDNVVLAVVDRDLQPVPIGVAGELLAGGDCVGAGYLGNDAETARRFIVVDGARMYRTGDLVRYRPDGVLEFLGRIDAQVKLRGFRIELGEVQRALERAPGVRQAAVQMLGSGQDKQLRAYLVPAVADPAAARALPGQVRAALRAVLPDYMVPSSYALIDAIPVSASGKVQFKALADVPCVTPERAWTAPATPAEEALAAIWEELLQVPAVGATDDFFELGGHSLLATRLVARLRWQLRRDLPLRAVFDHPRLDALSRCLEQAPRVADEPVPAAGGVTPIPVRGPGDAVPLSWAQQRLWFLDRLDPAAGAAYHMAAALRLHGPLERGALRAALDRVVGRHEILRTVFVQHGEQPLQSIAAPDCGFTLCEHDLSALAGHERESAVQRWRAEEASVPFDLAQGPLIRGRLLRLDAREHVLLLTMHHIIADGWSIGILVREIGMLYRAMLDDAPDPLPALGIQYGDYAIWQHSWLHGAALQRQRAFWRASLAGAPALLELPTDRSRPAVQTYAGASMPFVLPQALCARLRTCAQRHGATMFMLVLAGWSLLLARLGGQSELVIGTPVANRRHPDTEPLIGCFVNTLALRLRLDGSGDAAAWIAHVKSVTLAAFEHQDLPFEQVVEALRPPRSLSHSPLFQVMLAYDNTAGGMPDLAGLAWTPIEQRQDVTRVDLTLSISERDGGMAGSLRYATDLFDAATIARWSAHLLTVLEGLAEAGDGQPLARLPLLHDGERRQLLAEFHGVNAAGHVPPAQTIHQAFEARAGAHPHVTAVVHEGQRLSYGELNRQANRLAHHLRATGLAADGKVAICLERGVEMIVAILAVLKAGAAYVPLDPAYPAERLRHMLLDSAPAAVVTVADLLPCVAGHGAVPVLLDAAAAAIAARPDSNPDAGWTGARRLAYVIYTSGSTGLPKGVMVEHASALNFWAVMRETTHRGCAPHANVALNAAYSFDMSLKGILQMLSGHCLVIIPQQLRADPAAMLAFLAHHAIAAFDCTPSQLEPLLVAGLGRPDGYRPSDVLIGGEAIGTSMWQTLGRADGIRFHNMYGPTEATVDATIGRVDAGAPPHIGRPVAGARIYLLDRHGELVPIGVAGEIHIGGIGVARGYLNQPGLTAERFVPDPFSAVGGARMYRTGDLARWLPDGRLVYLGRNDHQIKLRGFRIEPGEIEARLRACEGVQDAVVLARREPSGDQRLCAYVVASADRFPGASALRRQLAGTLAEHMLPGAFVRLDAFPLTPNGKLDRAALPAPHGAAAVRPFAAPHGAAEIALAGIWEQLLGVGPVGRHDHFFELGGHSLLAVAMLARAGQVLGTRIALRDLFLHPTLMDLAATAGTGGTAGHPGLVPVRTAGAGRPLFLVHSGEGDVGYVRTLAPWIDVRLPVYGLVARGFQDAEVPCATVEQMAAGHIEAMRQVQPAGPYRLAGWSAGGTVAYEMARQLAQAHEAVEFLGLIDTSARYRPLAGMAAAAPVDGGTPGPDAMGAAILAWLPDAVDAPLAAQLRQLQQAGDIDGLLCACQQAGLVPAGLSLDELRRMLAVRYAIAAAVRRYVPAPVPCPIHLFAAADSPRADATLGWGANVTCTPVPGTHMTMVQAPHAESLGAAISAAIFAPDGCRVPDLPARANTPPAGSPVVKEDLS